MKILVTGATGFIGSHLTRRLVNEGYEVGIIRRAESDIWRIKDIYNQLTVFYTDFSDTELVANVVLDFKPDIVFHLAAYYAVDHKLPDIAPLLKTNILGLVNLLDASANAGAQLFVNTSTFFVYDRGVSGKNIKNIINPVNLYAVTKLQGEQVCNYFAEHGLNCVTFRLFPPYGEMENVRKFIPFVILSALKNESTELKTSPGFQKWDFIYVEDIVDAYLSLIPVYMSLAIAPDAPKPHYILDIGTGYSPTFRTVVNVILNAINSKINPVWGALPYRKNEVFYACADIRAAEKILNWKAKTSLDTGLKKTIEWYQKYLEEK